MVFMPRQKESSTALQLTDIAVAIVPGILFLAAAAASVTESVSPDTIGGLGSSNDIDLPTVTIAPLSNEEEESPLDTVKVEPGSPKSPSVLQKTINFFWAILKTLFSPLTAIFKSG